MGHSELDNKLAFEQFDKELAEASMRGQWQYDAMMESVIGGPRAGARPMLWSWELIKRKLR